MRRNSLIAAAQRVLPPVVPEGMAANPIKGKRSDVPRSRTTILALRYQDGIMCAADRKTSGWGYTIISQESRKIYQVSPTSVLLGSGVVGYIQEIRDSLTMRCTSFLRSYGLPISVQGQAKMLARWCNWYRRMEGWDFSFGGILAGVNLDGATHIIAVEEDGSRIEFHDYFASGSGGDGATVLLDAHWKPGLTEEQAAGLAVEAVYHAAFRDSGSSDVRVATPTIAVVGETGVRFMPEELIRLISFKVLMEKMGVTDIAGMMLADPRGEGDADLPPEPGPVSARAERRLKSRRRK
ncbi:MAG TPA: hypothetical protein VD862_01795 [Candidatus Paceibacterota bacterium]|nr:hypothetical protein [Candidatus Paceibacterota bacterium]